VAVLVLVKLSADLNRVRQQVIQLVSGPAAAARSRSGDAEVLLP
jgi:hypothetical protein